MDPTQFDRLTQGLAVRLSRRGTLRALLGAGALGLSAVHDSEAKKKKKGKKKKKKKSAPPGNMCLTVGGATICPPDRICCDSQRSTGGGCAPLGFPVCCLSDMFAHPAGTTCCDSPFSGNLGVCDHPGYPHCCPPSIPGCCEAGFPVCCNDPEDGGYCCPLGTICCPEDPTGCCPAQATELGAESVASATRGTISTASIRSAEELPRFEPLD
jgi:hypothetical protein